MNNRQKQRAAAHEARKKRMAENQQRADAHAAKVARNKEKRKSNTLKSVVPLNTVEEAESCIHNKGPNGRRFSLT